MKIICLSNLGNHPMIDALHASETAKGHLVIRCSFDNTASKVYAFSTSMSYEYHGTYVELKQSAKSCRLMVASEDCMYREKSCGIIPQQDSLSVGEWITLENGARIPNAPWLLVDVAQFFTSKQWTVLFEF